MPPTSSKKNIKKKKKITKMRSISRKSSVEHSSIAKSVRSGITEIKVIGVGGGGGNVVSRMAEGDRAKGVEFIAANTDAQDLNYATAHKKVYIGKALTRGLGAGMNPDIGKQAAEENRSEIGELIDGADVVFITCGLGGGTGTGASPVIADIAREKGILTIGIVTKPFSFEGTQRMNIAQEGLLKLKEKVDTLVVIPNDKIFAVINKDASVAKAFAYIDEILKNAVEGIAEIINTPGIINVDFADIETVMKDAGTALIGIGSAGGQDRAVKAATSAITSPLLEISVDGAKGLLFSIAGGKDVKMTEINDIAKVVSGSVDPSAKVIFGAYYDKKIKDNSIKVTVIATGFNGSGTFASGNGFELPTLFRKEERNDSLLNNIYSDNSESVRISTEEKTEKDPTIYKEKKSDEKNKINREEKKSDVWDIPTFLRKKKKSK
jgi:cell division protein FtsZ